MNDYLANVSIMVVDDQDFSLRIIRHVLEVLGATDVRLISDPREGWKEFQLSPPDVLILDWIMRPMDGISFAKNVRNTDSSPNPYVPIIMLTALSEVNQVKRARDVGINEYVVKPVSARVLSARIKAVIEKPRNFVRAARFFGPDRRRMKKPTLHDRRSGINRFGGG